MGFLPSRLRRLRPGCVWRVQAAVGLPGNLALQVNGGRLPPGRGMERSGSFCPRTSPAGVQDAIGGFEAQLRPACGGAWAVGEGTCCFTSSSSPSACFQGHRPWAGPRSVRNVHEVALSFFFLLGYKSSARKESRSETSVDEQGAGELAAPPEAAAGPGPEPQEALPLLPWVPHSLGCSGFPPVIRGPGSSAVDGTWRGTPWSCHVTFRSRVGHAGNASRFFPVGIAGSVRRRKCPSEPGKRAACVPISPLNAQGPV